MKRIVILFLTFSMVLLFIACKKDAVGKYVGIYQGTLSSQEVVKENVEFCFEIDNSNEEMLTMYGHSLKYREENQYTADAAIVLEVIHILYPKTTRTQLANSSALFVFEEKEVTMELTYSIAGNSEDQNMRFIGKKK